MLHAHHAGLGERRLAHRRPPRRPGRATARSGSTAGTVARSTQTEPCRTARTASATASSTRSSVLPAEVADPLGDVDVGGLQQPGRVERRQQPGGPAGQPPVVLADRLEQLGHARHHPVEQVGQRLDQGHRRPPGEDAARLAVDQRRVRAAHAAQVEVEHAAEVLARGRSRAAASAGTGAAPRRTAAPAAGSRSGPSLRPAPRGGRRAAVSGSSRRTEPVGLVVDDQVARPVGSRSTTSTEPVR